MKIGRRKRCPLLLLAFFVVLSGRAPASEPKIMDLPRVMPPRLGVVDSMTYTHFLESTKGYNRLEDLIQQEMKAVKLAEMNVQSGVYLSEDEKNTIHEIYGRYGSTDPINDFFRMNQVDLDTQTCDPEGKLYLLDDLSNLYTYYLVDFKKAHRYNRQTQQLYEKLSAQGIGNLPLSDYYNSRRALYYTFFYRMTDRNPIGFHILPGRIDLTTAYDKTYLDAIRKFDFNQVKARTDARNDFLKRQIEGKGKRLISHTEGDINNQDVKTLLKRIGLFVEAPDVYPAFQARFLHASNTFQVYEATGDEGYLQDIIVTCKRALDTPYQESISLQDSRNQLYYWLGLAYLKQGDYQRGVEYVAQFLSGIDKLESLEQQRFSQRQAVTEKVNQEVIAEREQQAMWSKVLVVASLALGAYMTLQSYGDMQAGSISQAQYQASQQIFKDALEFGFDINEQINKSVSRTKADADLRNEVARYITPYSLKVNRYLDKYQMVDFFLVLGIGYEQTGSNEKALENYEEAIRIIERQRSTILTENQRISFFAARQDLYARTVLLLAKMNRHGEALEFAERSRSRAFVDLLGSGSLKLKTPDQEKQFSHEITLQAEIDTILSEKSVGASQIKYFIEKRLRGIHVTPKSDEGGRSANDALELQSLSTVQTLSTEDIIHLVGNASLVEYFFARDKLLIFLVQSGEVRIFITDLIEEELETEINEWVDRIKQGEDGHKTGEALFHRLMFFADQITGTELVIIPHRLLHYVPFQALYDGQQFLVDRYAISYAPSATVLDFTMRKKAGNRKKLLIFGNPTRDLAFAEKEAQDISTLYPEARLVIRDSATETLLKNEAGQYGIIHLATHGEFNSQAPLESQIRLHPDGVNDGQLKTSELFSLKWLADLVTVSACETGLSENRTGDELIGLQRGLIFAGTRSVISSLWQVDDRATGMLMSSFYRNLKTMPKNRALQLAQIEARKSFATPYFWAAFNLTGARE